MGKLIAFNPNDIVGKKINNLTILKYIGKQPSKKYYFADWDGHRLYHKYKVKCDCGELSIVRRQTLIKKNAVNSCIHCKCKNYNSKMPKTYKVWSSLKEKTNSKKNNYCTINGIKVCNRWLKFENFLEDMGEKPEYKILLRIDKKKNFCKSNCKWGTYKDSVKRQSNTNLVSINGITKSLKGWFRYFKFTENQYDYYIDKRTKKKSLKKFLKLKDTDTVIEHYKIKAKT